MRRVLSIILITLFVASCGEKHFISDSNYREKVEQKFEERKEFAKNRSEQLFSVFNRNLSLEEEEALKFLFAYMPLCDLADYDGDFFLKQVRTAIEAKNIFPWGKDIPEEIFRHFVLPYRVNNENLDSARSVFFKELKNRIVDLPMKEAALEVNHWCHEKVNYQPTDIRTSGPLSTVRTSYGRCGEESTFTVTAMRTVGIPARQVYTPRWAHCDDNHAWVEVWVDGKWSYLGACEPEPALNMGWFTEPARRAMLVHTKVFGDYTGNDEVVKRSDNFTEINVVGNYADVKKVFVKIIDEDKEPVESATVDFGLYNYAEFYPIASKKTDKFGVTSLTTGLGDLLIWANKEGKTGKGKLSVSQIDTLTLVLNRKLNNSFSTDVDFYPPIEPAPYTVDEKLREENNVRLKKEDEIRETYRKTFITETKAKELSKTINLPESKIWEILKASAGNWKEIKFFIENASKEEREYLIPILTSIAPKDLRDTKASILFDHLRSGLKYIESKYDSPDIFVDYVINPRIKNENVLVYKEKFASHFADLTGEKRGETVANVIEWIKSNIELNESENYFNLPITPIGVAELKIANEESRNVFFVAVCRSLGVPSRLEQATKAPQYNDGGKWMNVYFSKQIQNQPKIGNIFLRNISKENKDPKYYIHFTLAKLIDGKYETADYDWQRKLSEFPDRIPLEVGAYRLVTGNRDSKGNVYTNLTYFEIKDGKTKYVDLNVRSYKKAPEILGKVVLKNCPDFKGKEYQILGFIEPDKEPTKHAFADFKHLKDNFEKWGGNITLIIPESKKTESFNKDLIRELPNNVQFPKENMKSLFEEVTTELDLKAGISYPLIMVLTRKGEIIYASQGYKIGIGEQLLKIIQ